MSGSAPTLFDGARALAEAFDRSFAIARPAAPPTPRDFLTVRIGGDPHAIGLLDLAELVPLGKLAALPGNPSECLGLAGVRGGAVPVYDLRVLLGYAGGGETAPWLAILASARVALAFDAVEGFLRLPDDAEGDAATAQRHVRQVLRSGDAALPVLDTDSLLAAIRGRADS
ncbi:MAG: chemotaxis protein CheW [Sphingomonas sp.]|uniref:chemotaxis protein CheW n=1 Tax=Sphingomonas sp. TaxID=28214 RepID=UPI002273E5F4|nr:chemotaxis protein CheW [Sphingomonas sp.]MCX8477367.1 chemotaxis protein CheW [Sphingomonas sp.]